MKTIKTIVLLSFISIFISCGENSKKHDNDTEHKHTESAEVNEKEHKDELKKEHHEVKEVLSLNKGSLWDANSETTSGINNMIGLMDSFTEKETVKSYNSLKGSLEKEFMSILTNCTMEGESHNQLHTYLVPMKDAFKGLESDDLTICKKSFENLNIRLAEYNTYFK